uniref:hypothetical protein n=2 Tax=Enterocloster clostridioformis TaxID=1531 RepID=UPI0026F09C34|nr:hypothetical protein [Enterocloster clostridioformis]
MMVNVPNQRGETGAGFNSAPEHRQMKKRTILGMIRLLEKSILKGRRADKFLSARVL